MKNRLSNWLTINAKGWLILLLLGLFLTFSLVVMPFGQSWFGGTADEVGSIDLTFGAAPETIFEKVAGYGDRGRQVYSIFALTADLVYPAIYSLFFSLAITYLFQRSFSTERWIQHLHMIPFVAFVFDIAENIAIVSLLASYPQEQIWLALLTILFNGIKWVFVGGSVLLLSGLAAVLISKRPKA